MNNDNKPKLPLLYLSSDHQEILKYITIVLMVLDHYAKINYDLMHWLHYPARVVFPFFAYILVYNYMKRTSNKVKYLTKLFVFALISQPIYVYAFGTPYDFLNILFSLFFGLLSIALYEEYHKRTKDFTKNKKTGSNVIGLLIGALAFGYLGLHLSYFWFGLMMIFAFYNYLKHESVDTLLLLVGSIFIVNLQSADVLKWFSSLGLFPLVWMVSHSKIKIKRIPGLLFYLFYPVHLFLLRFIS